MKTIFIIGIIIVIGYLAYNYFIKYPYRYIGYFYPSIENMDKWVESEPLSSVDECRDWVNGMINQYNLADSDNYDYECGKDCYKGDPYSQGVKYTCHTSED